MAAAEHQRELLMLLAQRAQLGRGSCEETVAIQREILEIYSDVPERVLGVINWHLR